MTQATAHAAILAQYAHIAERKADKLFRTNIFEIETLEGRALVAERDYLRDHGVVFDAKTTFPTSANLTESICQLNREFHERAARIDAIGKKTDALIAHHRGEA